VYIPHINLCYHWGSLVHIPHIKVYPTSDNLCPYPTSTCVTTGVHLCIYPTSRCTQTMISYTQNTHQLVLPLGFTCTYTPYPIALLVWQKEPKFFIWSITNQRNYCNYCVDCPPFILWVSVVSSA